MKLLNKYKVSLVFAAVWLACTVTYLLATNEVTKYAARQEDATTLLKFHECSGSVIFYSDLGYRCDGYAPSPFLLVIIAIGIVAFIGTLFSLFMILTRKPAKS